MIGDFALDSTVTYLFTTRAGGIPAALVGGVVSIYRDNSPLQTTSGVTLTTNFDGQTGLNLVTIATTDHSFYTVDATYALVLTAGTVGGNAAAGTELDRFRLVAASILVPQTYPVGSLVTYAFTTRAGGVPTTLVGGVVSVYRDSSTTETTSGVTLTADFDGQTGLNLVTITTTDPTVYRAGSTYALVLTAGTVGGNSVAGTALDQIRLIPATGTPVDTFTVTAADLITAALKRIRVVGAGEVPTANDQEDAFKRLNSLIRSWSLQRGMVNEIRRTTWTLVPNQASYSVGETGDIPIARPASPSAIEGVGIQDLTTSPPTEYLVTKPLDEQGYRSLVQKTLTSTLPSEWYYAPTRPTGTLSPWPIPTQSSPLEGVIYVPTPVTVFPTVTTRMVLSHGYDLALIDNLAVLLAPEWGAVVPDELRLSARESRMAIETRNLRINVLTTGEAGWLFGGGMGAGNIYSGEV